MTPATTSTDLLARQLAGIASWHTRARAARQEIALTRALSREQLLSQHRRADVLDRQHAALVAHLTSALVDSGEQPLSRSAPIRVVVGHRHLWFRTALAAALEASGVNAVWMTDNGADLIGITVAEQPDLLVLDSNLLMVPTEEVLVEVRELAPGTFVAAQLGDRVAASMLAADATFARREHADAVVRTVLAALSGTDALARPMPETAASVAC